ncbi:hypothetical protein OPHB3_1134 [Oceanobacillus picturae]|uniref:ABC-2 family transporter protein n=1 Tax=Oceanobacillus picturae TaxID=171693 RepID=W9BDX1_9BACI|nr:hypothetical protein [Oceanobacillus picturae]GAQ17209.1 hypothetical protein OPHB3_1134 [Oceanobacillus picturae]CDO04450.1 hypothetical protein BN988_03008 [Oceanobacillus picturae]
MGRQFKGLLYFFSSNVRHSLLIFWTILMSILVVTLTISYFLLNVEGEMAFSLTAPMYVYCGIMGFITVKEMVPFSIKMGATRKNLYVVIAIFFLLLSLFKAIAGTIIQVLVTSMNEAIGLNNFDFLHLAQFIDDTWYTRVVIDTAVMFFFLTLMFLLGLLFYRFGFAGAGSVLGILLVGLLLSIAKGWAWDFITNIVESFGMTFFLQMTIMSIVFYVLSFFLVRRITI